MKTALHNRQPSEEGSILAYFILLLILAGAIGSVGAYLTQTVSVAHRRNDMIAANQYSQSGAVIGCIDLNAAFSKVGTVAGNLASSPSAPYVKNTALSTSLSNVYERTITSPFTNQTAFAQIWMPNVSVPDSAKVISSAKVGQVTQASTVNLNLAFAYGAAIISLNDGTTSTSADKPTAQAGNVVVSGNGSGPLIVNGGKSWSILSNGRANIGGGSVSSTSISMTNGVGSDPIPDWTSQGTTNMLFDFGRYIAAANATANPFNPTANNHFTNWISFAAALSNAPSHTFEGVVVVDIKMTDKKWGQAGDIASYPYGINIHGTLFYNFGPEFGPLDKFPMTASLNINPADLSTVVPSNPATYTTGYPPVYTDPSKNPTNINIWPAYTNFMAGEDLPALMYSIGTVDIHGPANISGVVYTPSYMEIENKVDGDWQYFNGALMMGDGIFYENSKAATSIITYDPKSINNLATVGARGKKLMVAYWQ